MTINTICNQTITRSKESRKRLLTGVLAASYLLAAPGYGAAADLLVGSITTNSVKQFNGTTMAYIRDIVGPESGGLSVPTGISQGPADGNLYVASCGTGSVKKYSGVNGAYLGDFAKTGGGTCPYGVQWDPNGNMLVAEVNSGNASGSVMLFNASGQFVKTLIANGNGNMTTPQAILLSEDGTMLVADANSSSVLQFSSSGQFIRVFAHLANGDPSSIRVAPDHSICVTWFYGHQIRKYDPLTGADLGLEAQSDVAWPVDIAWDSNGNLLDTDRYTGAVRRYLGGPGVGNIGAYLTDAITAGRGGLSEIYGLAWFTPCVQTCAPQ